MKGAEKLRDKAKEEAQVARLAVVTTGDPKAQAEEAKRKAEAETAHLEVEQMSLLLEIEAVKNEVCSLQS